MFQDIFVNVFILLAVYLLTGSFMRVQPAQNDWKQQLLQGVIGGVLGLILVVFGIYFPGMGINLDLRHIPIVMAAAFLNTYSTILTAAIIAAGRIMYHFGLISIQAGLVVLLVGIGSALLNWRVKTRWRRALLVWVWSVGGLSAWYYHLMKQDLSVAPPVFLLSFWSTSALTGWLTYLILSNQVRSQDRDRVLQESLTELRKRNQEIERQQQEIQRYHREQERLIEEVQLDNITIEQKNEELRDQHERLEEVLESIKEIFMSLDQSWQYIYLNEAAEAFIGCSRNSLLGKVIWEQFPRLQGTAFEKYYRKTMEERIPYEFETFHGTRGIWLEVRTYPSKQGITVYISDISERKLLEMKLWEQNQELEELAYKDGLTGIGNRRFFDMVMQKEWANAYKQQQPLALVMLDIDYFKLYNDSFGHEQGDICLQRVAQALKDAVRENDYVVRYGGEEFAVLLPFTSVEGARKIAERIRTSVHDLCISHPYAPSGILTVSIGVDDMVPDSTEKKSLLAGADAALYEAKKAGRNQIVVR